mmetsp:Transcript_41815/g.47516  ORF Transcript_41815/g.47516 Transcript_41815/m.47516 type:complete len:501 (-) Transcript_41815:46-1548(-)
MSGSEVDVLIIGGGFTGCWFARKIRDEHPELSVRLVEASNRIGGRLKSDDNDQDGDTTVKDELGGMRIFPSKMPKIMALVNEFNLKLEKLSLKDTENFCQFRGKSTQKKNSHDIMPTNGKWAGKKPTEMANFAKRAYMDSIYWEKCGNKAYNCPELRNLSIREFFKKYADASDDEIAFWFSYMGYDLYHDDVQCSIWIADGELYGSEITHHHFVHEGYGKVVENLYARSGVAAEFGTKVMSLEKKGKYKVLAKTQNRAGQINEIMAKKVILGMTAKQLGEIEGLERFFPAERMAAIKGCKAIPLFKCFLEFRPNKETGQPWYFDKGLKSGKSTSDGNARQMHYYDGDDILVYVSDGDKASNKHASYWGDALAKSGYEHSDERTAVLQEMWDEVKQLHLDQGVATEDEMPDPIWSECVFAYWPGGSHKWKKGVDVRKAIDCITGGGGGDDGSNVFIGGDAFSDMQGWVEGALDTNELAYVNAFKNYSKKSKRIDNDVGLWC